MRRHIALYINLDMVASPNFARFVQGAAATGDGLAAVVRRELLAEFREHNLSVEERAEGRFGSDGASFSQKGIPTMGLYTGAGGPKSEIQASLLAVRLVALTIPAIIGPVTLSRISTVTFWSRTPAHWCVRSTPRRSQLNAKYYVIRARRERPAGAPSSRA